jgi:hypothetical protein
MRFGKALVPALLFGAPLLTVGAMPGAQAAQLIVVETRGSDLKTGQSVDGGAPLNLPAGARVVMVSAEGTTLTLKGPFNGPPEGDGGGGKGNKVADSLKNLVAARAADTTSLGAARNGSQVELPDPWLWDATAIGDVCKREGERTVLWRPAGDAEAALTILPADRSWTATAKWPAGSVTLALPADLPIGDGDTFLLEMAGSSAALTVHVAPSGLSTEAGQVAWMALSRCDRQLTSMAKRVAADQPQ